MNFFIGNPALLPLAALISLPILIHFYARARPRIYQFSSIEFLQKIVKESSRLKRPRSWLLLILRTLLVAALILLFLKPILRTDAPLADALARKNVMILVDASASMAAIEGGATRFATARAKAGEILSGLTGQDGANVIWLRSPAQPVFPVLGVNKSALQDALRDAATSNEVADIRGAFALALQQLKDTDGAKEIFVISDFQQSNWEDFRLEDHPGIRLTLIPVADTPVGNQAVTDIFVSSSRPLRGQPVEILCEVANYSSEPALRRV
ncbi:MAG: BatA and WFA domain-containing protein, partial [Verrucomicrobiota bacterium]